MSIVSGEEEADKERAMEGEEEEDVEGDESGDRAGTSSTSVRLISLFPSSINAGKQQRDNSDDKERLDLKNCQKTMIPPSSSCQSPSHSVAHPGWEKRSCPWILRDRTTGTGRKKTNRSSRQNASVCSIY